MVRLALIENESDLRSSLTRMLSRGGYPPEVFQNAQDFLGSESASNFEVVVTEFPMEGTEAADVLKACRAVPDPPAVLLVAAPNSVGAALEATRLGAFDYIPKPVDPRELVHRVGLALELRKLKRESRAFSGEGRRRHGLAPPIGESLIMQDFRARARNGPAASSPGLLLAEPGR